MALLFGATSLNSFAGSILGGWYLTHGGQADSTVVITMFPDGRFMEIEDGNSVLDPSGHDGLEKGTFSWLPVTGDFSVNLLLDTNGEWGFSSLPPEANLSATNTTLTLTTFDGTFQATKLVDATSSIVGAWYLTTGPNPQDLTVVAFLPDGRFMIGIDPPQAGFVELGTYTFNPVTNVLIAQSTFSNAPMGVSFNLPSFTAVTVFNGMLQLTSPTGAVTLASVAAPEPGTLSMLVAGFVGALAVRRRRSGSRN